MSYRRGHYEREGGIHGVPLGRIALFTLNNTATNLYLFMFGYVFYLLTGVIGVGVAVVGTFTLAMRMWDGVTDPFIGYVLDRTSTRFGKNRPFMLIGNLILLASSAVLYWVIPQIQGEKAALLRFPLFVAVSAIYYIGYTFQCVVTKSAQTCLTNDPKQRPYFAVFDAIYNIILFTGGTFFVSNVLAPKHGKLSNLSFHHELWQIAVLTSFVFTCLAVWAIAPKDCPRFFGVGKPIRVRFRDYVDVLVHNRAIQMLVISASTDKLAGTAKTSVMATVLFAITAGNFALNGPFSIITSLLSVLLIVLAMSQCASRLGQKVTMVVGSIGVIVMNTALIALWKLGDPRTLEFPNFLNYKGNFHGWTTFTVLLLLFSVLAAGFQGMSGNIVIPMTADCADYETYRSGRYVPGLIGTLFSFVDKMVSSLGPFIASMLLVGIGFKNKMPDVDTPYSEPLLNVALFCTYGLIILGSICNVVAMRFYPLSKQKMSEIQDEIGRIKAAYFAEVQQEK